MCLCATFNAFCCSSVSVWFPTRYCQVLERDGREILLLFLLKSLISVACGISTSWQGLVFKVDYFRFLASCVCIQYFFLLFYHFSSCCVLLLNDRKHLATHQEGTVLDHKNTRNSAVQRSFLLCLNISYILSTCLCVWVVAGCHSVECFASVGTDRFSVLTSSASQTAVTNRNLVGVYKQNILQAEVLSYLLFFLGFYMGLMSFVHF